MYRYVLLTLLSSATIVYSKNEQFCESELSSSRCVCGYGVYGSLKTNFVVNCARTDLPTFPSVENLPQNLNVLDVSHNKITDLQIHDGRFETLKWLICTFNEITTISGDFLSRTPHLTHLDLSHNKITNLDNKLFLGVPNLVILDISYNELQVLQDGLFSKLSKLKSIDISYNYIGKQLSGYKTIIDSPLGLSKTLERIRLNYVNLTDISNMFFQNTSIVSLSIADNYLERIPQLPDTIEHLDVSGNYIKILNVGQLKYKKLINLKLNRLTELYDIEPYTFYNVPALEYLSMEHCSKLRELNDLAFGVLNENEEWKLKEISFSGSGLIGLNETYFKLFNTLEAIKLDRNPWYCDCSVQWFRNLGKKLPNKNKIRCAGPLKLRNKMITELDDTTLPKCAVGAGWQMHKILVVIISILVVALIAVILYLIYLGPFIRSGNPNTYIGAQSPYSHLVVTDDV